MPRRVQRIAHRASHEVRPGSGGTHPIFHPGRAHLLPKGGIPRPPVRANDSETQTPLEFRPYGAEG